MSEMSFCKKELEKRTLPEIWPDKSLDWETRRLEIADILQSELFGYRPADPEEISFRTVENDPLQTFCGGKASKIEIEITTKINGKTFMFPACAVIPREKKDLPFFVHINFRRNVPDLYMPSEELVDNGFAVFSFGYEDVTADNEDFTDGLAGVLYEGRERRGSDCGKIPMWSWAASRVMDFCQTLDCLDFSRSAVVGFSRLGKTALFTGMLDTRFQYVISHESGFAGAALNRNRKFYNGCSVEFCVNNHMQWFAPNYRKYANREDEMPYDQHFLVGASAPRAVYVGSAVLDFWSDPMSEYLSCCAVSEVYEHLGMTGFVHADRYPEEGEILQEGNVAYHIRKGQHFFSRDDWNLYCQYIKNHKTQDRV